MNGSDRIQKLKSSFQKVRDERVKSASAGRLFINFQFYNRSVERLVWTIWTVTVHLQSNFNGLNIFFEPRRVKHSVRSDDVLG